MGETELWVFRLMGTVSGAIMIDYICNVRGGDLFRRKKDCETIAQIFHKENREDHQAITKELQNVGRAIATLEGEVRRMNGNKSNA